MELPPHPLPHARNRGNLRLCLESFIVPSARCRKNGASALATAAYARACSTRACAKTDITIAVPVAKPATWKRNTSRTSRDRVIWRSGDRVICNHFNTATDDSCQDVIQDKINQELLLLG